MLYNSNGIIIQQPTQENIFVAKYMKKTKYNGVHKYVTFPLSSFSNDLECKEISERQFAKKIDETHYQILEFISDAILLKDYLRKMKELKLPYRLIYVESQFEDEKCEFDVLYKKFLGYEVCEIPFDPWTLLDLFNREQFTKYKDILNENGLFANESDALKFMNDYKFQLSKGLVGDGVVDLYLCRVYEVENEYFN